MQLNRSHPKLNLEMDVLDSKSLQVYSYLEGEYYH